MMQRIFVQIPRCTPAILALFPVVMAVTAAAQSANYPYVVQTIAGTFPLGDGGPATQALLYYPLAVTLDQAGNIYVLDASNYRIRKFTLNGAISTVAELPGHGQDMKIGPDGNFYVTLPSQVLRITPGGNMTVVAGKGLPGAGVAGLSQDGIPAATAALTSLTAGIAFDPSGNLYFVDANRVREVTADGLIHTVAGNTNGYAFNGDDQPATSANLYEPGQIAFDKAGNLYIADSYNYRIRKVSGGQITTVAGSGFGVPQPGPATASPLGVPYGLAVDSSGNIYFSDNFFSLAFKITNGVLTQIAGTTNFGYGDGPANSSYLFAPQGIAVDGSGNVFIADVDSNRIREITNGNLVTVAGRLHYSGDGGPATAALFNQPDDLALDQDGNIFVADSRNFRVREITPDKNVHTSAGTGIFNSPLGVSEAMAMDSAGNLYYASPTQVSKITLAGVVSVFAGTGTLGNSGDGGPASQATFAQIRGIAVDASGNVYIADTDENRVRKVSGSSGIITNYAGSPIGQFGDTGDNGPATSALLSFYGPSPLAVDQNGNLYIGDGYNNVVRKVSTDQTITTVVGNSTFGLPTDGAQARSTPFPGAAGIAVDASGQLYLTSQVYATAYRVDSSGAIHLISGGGFASLVDGAVATSTIGFGGAGLRVDANGDLYATDPFGNMVHKLILNSPGSLTISGGDHQTAPTGSALPVNLSVTLNGRAGIPLKGIAVAFAVTSGSATLSASSVQTDVNGTASVSLTLGSAVGDVVVAASVPGTGVPARNFTETATAFNPNCPVGLPSISSVQSASDFGGFLSFGPGSWLEVKGANLTSDATARQWAGSDFQGANAPTSLDGSSVSINGNLGFVSYISAGQINVQAPMDSTVGPVQIAVTTCAGTSAPVTVQEVAAEPGMLAPQSFNIGGQQYMVATFADTSNGLTYVGNPGLIPGLLFRPAKPGDLIIVYGIGFGAVSPAIAPGIVVSQENNLPGVTVNFGTTPASIVFAGLAGNYVGLYEFYLTVPAVPDGDYQINMSLSQTQLQQTMYLTVHQ